MEMISPTIFMPALLSTHRVGLSMAARIRLEGLLRLEPLLRVPEAVACRNGIVMSSFAWQLYLDGLHGLPAARRRICASDSRDNHGQSVGDGTWPCTTSAWPCTTCRTIPFSCHRKYLPRRARNTDMSVMTKIVIYAGTDSGKYVLVLQLQEDNPYLGEPVVIKTPTDDTF